MLKSSNDSHTPDTHELRAMLASNLKAQEGVSLWLALLASVNLVLTLTGLSEYMIINVIAYIFLLYFAVKFVKGARKNKHLLQEINQALEAEK